MGMRKRIDKCLDFLYIVYNSFFSEDKDPGIKRIKGVRDYCLSNNIEIHTLLDGEECNIINPGFFMGRKEEIVKKVTPEVYCTFLENAEVVGNSSAVLMGRYLLNDAKANDSENRIDIRDNVIRIGFKKSALITTDRGHKNEYDKAISLLGSASSNYYHLLIETIARLVVIDSKGISADYPLLIDEAVSKVGQYSEAIDYFNVNKREIIYVSQCEKVKVRSLLYISPIVWMPMNTYDRYALRVNDFALCYSAIRLLREMVKDIEPDHRYDRIFISRVNTANSRLRNEKEISELFVNNGFKIVRTEEMSFREQVACFKAARWIAGASGAALTNTVFCEPGVILSCIIPSENNFCLYSTIIGCVGGNNYFLEPQIIHKDPYAALDIIELDTDYATAYMEEVSKNNIFDIE